MASSTKKLGVPTAALSLALALLLGLAGCAGETAGTTSYKNPTANSPEGVHISAQTLMTWADEGRINAPFGTAGRVVVVSVTTPANFVTRRHIPDALLLDSASELSMTRAEGLGPAGVMMLSGPAMDALVQKLGIDGSTTIVLTHPRGSSDSEHLAPAVAYWTLRYWGFPKERLKMLNGGDDAWEVAGQTLTDAVVAAQPSSYSVRAHGAIKDSLRYSVGEVLALVDTLNRDPIQRSGWQMLDVRGFTVSPYIANAWRGNGPMQFVLDRVNGETSRNRLYPNRETALARLASLSVMDGTTPVFMTPERKLISMCGTSFNCAPIFVVFDAVLGVPEGNAAMYDGSSTQWTNYSTARILQAGATPAQAAVWAFDAVTGGTALTRAIGTLPAPVVGQNFFVPGSFVYLPTQPEANQIETEDRQYMSGGGGGGPAAPPGGGGGSGC